MLQKYKIKNGKVECLECGQFFKRVGRHIYNSHGLTAYDYKKLHGLDTGAGLITPDDKERMQQHIKDNPKVIKNLANGQATRFTKGDPRIHYERSEQTKERLKEHWARIASRGGRPQSVAKVTIKCHECGKEHKIYPRYVREDGRNYCGVSCRNAGNNRRRKIADTTEAK